VPNLRRDLLILVGWIAAGAVVVVVFGFLVVPAVWSLDRTPTPTCPCGAPPFEIANPIGPTPCDGANSPIEGCLSAGDYVVGLSIESSSFNFGEVYLRVVISSTGANYTPSGGGGFFILNSTGEAVAEYVLSPGGTLSMSGPSAWTYVSSNVSSATPLTAPYSIEIDVGSTAPPADAYTAVAWVTPSVAGYPNGYSSAVGLP
jgi:hypothetical protein